jgi:PPOX class probable F420-dependent enzyme
MSQSDIEEFVSAARFGVVATNRFNGPPQLTPVWYLYENEKVYMSMFVESVKYRNLCRDPRASICISGDCPDARAVIFSGPVELFIEDSEPWISDIIWKLVRRYYDSDEEAKEYIQSSASSGQGALVVLSPEKIIAQDYN